MCAINSNSETEAVFRYRMPGLVLAVGAMLLSGMASAVTETASPTACTSVSGIGTQAWSNPARAISSDNKYAAASTALAGTTTQYLQCTGYNFAIPAGATINGITVNVERKFGSLSGAAKDAAVRLVKAGVIGATDRSTATSYTNADVTEAHGGANDLWGASWAAADINAANFGAAFAASASGVASTVSVDYISITVDYSFTPPPATRFYMQNSAPDIAAVTTNRGAWDSTASVLQRKLSRTKSGAIASKGVAETSATNNYDVLILKLVSEPIPVAQTISGTLSFVAGSQESSTNMNANWHVHAYVTVGDTDTLRGTLVNNYTEAAGTNEWPATAMGDGPVAPLALTPVTISANDRIVIEAGYVARNTSTTSRTGTLWYGGTNATDLGLNGDETTLPGWWEFDSDLFVISTAPHHIQISHDGGGQTCRPESLTVTACANAACSVPNFNLATVTGNVTWSGSPGGAIPFTIASGGTGQTTVLLPVATAQTVTLGTSSVSPAETNPPSTCINSSGGAACSLVFTSASTCFDAVEVGAAISTPIFTKLSGMPFSLDVLTDSSYSGTLQVELVNASSGNCATYTSLNTQSTTFTSQARKTLNFTYANAAKDVRVRITGLAGSSCSTDRFAVRPPYLTVTSNANADAGGANTGAAPTVKAGTAFTLYADTALAGYDGTPLLDNAKVAAHGGAVTVGTVAGVFGAANPATGQASGSNFSYSEVGYFKMNVDGVYDNTFTAVDSAAGHCTNDYSNTLDATGKYGCNFGNAAASGFFGRFIPDHFDTAITEVTPGAGGTEAYCADDFTYSAQPFIAQVSAENFAGGVTHNYDATAGFSKAVTLSDDNAVAGGALANPAVTAASFASGVASTPNPTTSASPRYTFTSTKTSPATIKLRADEGAGGDGVSSATGIEDTMEIRSGHLLLGNAHGSELLGLDIPIAIQYWAAGGYYATNTADNCTMIPASSIVMDNFTQNLTACKTQLSPTGNMNFVGGLLPSMRLSAPGAGNNGSVNLTVNVGNVAAGNTCVGASASAAVAAKVPWLSTNTGRATFGVYKGSNEFIYLREAY